MVYIGLLFSASLFLEQNLTIVSGFSPDCYGVVFDGCPAGTVSTAAYKRWEKAAIAGVSLVADAAEHLERATTDKEVEHAQLTLGEDCN